jgi:putative ABC transport system permease protein
VVLGADVANTLGYSLDNAVVLFHDTGKVSFTHHDDHPFQVVGILQPTGTPIDQSLYVPLQSIDIIHQRQHVYDQLLSQMPLGFNVRPKISAFLLGVKSRIAVLSLQRNINQFKSEPISPVMPAVALRELWQIVRVVEDILGIRSWLILATALICMTTMSLTSMQEREKELAVLHVLGAKARIIILLIAVKAFLLTLLGAVIGYVVLTLGLLIAQPILEQYFALYISPFADFTSVLEYLLLALAGAILLSLLPAGLAYKHSLQNGLKQ